MKLKRSRRVDFGALMGLLGFAAGGIGLAGTFDQPALAATFTSINGLFGAVTFTSTDSTLLVATAGQTVNYGLNLAKANTWTGQQIFTTSTAIFQAPTAIRTDGVMWINDNGVVTSTINEICSCSAGLIFNVPTGSSISYRFNGGGFLTMTQSGGNDIVQFGAITNFQAGSATNVLQLTTSGIGNTQGLQSLVATTLAIGTSTTVTLPVAEPNTSYGVVCTLENATPLALSISAKTTTNFVINYPAIGAAELASCIVIHQ